MGSGGAEHHCPAWFTASNTPSMWLFPALEGAWARLALPRDPSRNVGWRVPPGLCGRAELCRLGPGGQKRSSH